MRAVILAGGRGTRLAPYTTAFPKPLMPIGEIPIVEIVIRQLRHFGFTRITLAVGHLGALLRAYIETNPIQFQGLTIDFVHEDKPTGTAGALANIGGLTDTFLAMNGDILTDLDYARLVEHHRALGACLTIASYSKHLSINLGVVESDAHGLVVGYREKPMLVYPVSMGIYVYEPRALRVLGPAERLDFPDLVHRLLQANERVATFPWNGFWLDIGRPEDYEEAVVAFAREAKTFNLD